MEELIARPRGCEGACARAQSQGGLGGTDRRQFLTLGAAALAGLALVACGMGDSTAPRSIAATTITLSDHESLANVGGVAVLQISGSPIALVRETAGTFSAFSLICPHAGNTVEATGSPPFYCPGHGAEFSLTGQWIGGQRTSNLMSYPVVYDAGAGSVVVGGGNDARLGRLRDSERLAFWVMGPALWVGQGQQGRERFGFWAVSSTFSSRGLGRGRVVRLPLATLRRLAGCSGPIRSRMPTGLSPTDGRHVP